MHTIKAIIKAFGLKVLLGTTLYLSEGSMVRESLKAFSIHSSSLCVNSLTSCCAPV